MWDPRDQAAQDVALEVLLHGPLSRADIARRLGFAPATLTRASAELIGAGLLVETGQVLEGRGRPSTLLNVVPETHHFLGIKLSGDSLTTVVTDLRAQPVSPVQSHAHEKDPNAVAQQIGDLAREAQRTHMLDGIGIAVGGVVRPRGEIASAPFLEWEGVPLAAMVEQRAGIHTSCTNDLEAYTRAQHWFGEGSGHDNFAVVTLGVGVGFGCVANGRPLVNADSGVGLVGHWPLDPLGPLCSRGHRGCAEAMLTMPLIQRELASTTGRDVGWDEIIQSARRGDDVTTRVLARSGQALGKLIAAIANLTAPDFVLIGGEGVELADVTTDEMRIGISSHRDPRSGPVSVVLASQSNEEWCRGAAVSALQDFVLGRGIARRSPVGS